MMHDEVAVEQLESLDLRNFTWLEGTGTITTYLEI